MMGGDRQEIERLRNGLKLIERALGEGNIAKALTILIALDEPSPRNSKASSCGSS